MDTTGGATRLAWMDLGRCIAAICVIAIHVSGVFCKDIDRIMAGLNSHSNIEIRVFNPFGSAREGVFERTTNVLDRKSVV